MVADNLDGNLLFLIIVITVTHIDDPLHNREQQVRFEVRFFLLNDRCQSFQPGTRINVFLFQRFIRSVFCLIKLCENEIPNFQITVAITADIAGGLTASPFRAEIVKNFRVGSARAFTDFPEIIFQFKNSFIRQTDDIMPNIISFFIFGINGNIQFIRIKLKNFSQKLPRPGNSFLLEIITEGKIAEHFKKSMMACRTTDIIDVTRTNTFLTGCHAIRGRYQLTGKIGLERSHTGTNKK